MSTSYASALTLVRDIDSAGSTAETNTELVAASSDVIINVAYIFFSCDTAMEVLLESGNSTEKFRFYPAANGGANILSPYGTFLFTTTAGDSLTYTTSAAGKHMIVVGYR